MFEVYVPDNPDSTQFTLRNIEKDRYISLNDKKQIKLKPVSVRVVCAV